MDKKERETYLYIIGFVFVLIYLYILTIFILTEYVIGLTWMCYLGILFITIGIFLKNSDIILSQVYILLIPDFLWGIDFFYRLIFGYSLLNFDNFFFTSRPLWRKLLSLQHLITPYLAISSLYFLKIKKKKIKPLLISIFELIIIFILGIKVFPAKEGINCLPDYNSCFFSRSLPFLNYQFGWFLFELLFVIVAYFIINRLKFLFEKEN